jgi:mediator of RNA polymerase II transcription subunit 16
MLQSIHFLKKLEGFTVNKIAIAMQPMNLGKIICYAYSDSSVEYRDRNTMTEAFTDGDLDRVWHLAQIGFSYIEDEPCKTSRFDGEFDLLLILIGLQFALSPSYCSIVQIRNDGKIKWKHLEYHMGDMGSNVEDRAKSFSLIKKT